MIPRPVTRTDIVDAYQKALAKADAEFYRTTAKQREIRERAMAEAEEAYRHALSLLPAKPNYPKRRIPTSQRKQNIEKEKE